MRPVRKTANRQGREHEKCKRGIDDEKRKGKKTRETEGKARRSSRDFRARTCIPGAARSIPAWTGPMRLFTSSRFLRGSCVPTTISVVAGQLRICFKNLTHIALYFVFFKGEICTRRAGKLYNARSRPRLHRSQF